MKKPLLIFLAVLLSIALVIVNWYWFSKAHITPNDLIINVSTDSLTKISEKDITAYYDKNQKDMKAVAEYLLANEKLFGSRPVILNENSSEYINKITDETIRKTVERLLDEGIVNEIYSLNDDIKNVYFRAGYEYGLYMQGIRYVSDTGTVSEKTAKYNYVQESTSLGNGWFYYINYYNAIKDADVYRKIVWDKMSAKDKKSVIYDWEKAIVTLADWKTVGYKLDNKDREFVVAVTFNTDVDGLLGPIVAYLDPVTKEIVGGSLRM